MMGALTSFPIAWKCHQVQALQPLFTISYMAAFTDEWSCACLAHRGHCVQSILEWNFGLQGKEALAHELHTV